jgi:hypothetical protein
MNVSLYPKINDMNEIQMLEERIRKTKNQILIIKLIDKLNNLSIKDLNISKGRKGVICRASIKKLSHFRGENNEIIRFSTPISIKRVNEIDVPTIEEEIIYSVKKSFYKKVEKIKIKNHY